MAAITKSTMLGIIASLRTAAVKAELMTEDQYLIYSEGVAAGGVPAAVWLDQRGTAVPFLPAFGVIPKREQYAIVQGALYALMAINNHKAEQEVNA